MTELNLLAKKLYSIAQTSLFENPSLKKVVILKQNFCCDTLKTDPEEIKYRLTEYTNDTLQQIWKKAGSH